MFELGTLLYFPSQSDLPGSSLISGRGKYVQDFGCGKTPAWWPEIMIVAVNKGNVHSSLELWFLWSSAVLAKCEGGEHDCSLGTSLPQYRACKKNSWSLVRTWIGKPFSLAQYYNLARWGHECFAHGSVLTYRIVQDEIMSDGTSNFERKGDNTWIGQRHTVVATGSAVQTYTACHSFRSVTPFDLLLEVSLWIVWTYLKPLILGPGPSKALADMYVVSFEDSYIIYWTLLEHVML